MDLLLWRHAHALDGGPDLLRPLSEKGRLQAARMATWLQGILPRHARILVSPALRTRQTAETLARDYQVIQDLAPGFGVEALLRATGWPHARDPVLVVGHQPSLGQTCRQLLCGAGTEMSLQKGALVWLEHRERNGQKQTLLKAAMSPDLLRTDPVHPTGDGD